MKIINLIVILVLVLLTISCKKYDNDLINPNYEEKVKEFKDYFFEEPFESIFSNYDEKYMTRIIYPSGISSNGYCGLIFTYETKKSNFDSVYSLIKSKSFFRSKLENHQKFYVPDYRKTNLSKKYPIINLNDSFQNFNKIINKKESEVFIFKKDTGNFFKNKGIKKIEKWTKLENNNFEGKGFSNGAIIDYSNYFIIYWTIIW